MCSYKVRLSKWFRLLSWILWVHHRFSLKWIFWMYLTIIKDISKITKIRIYLTSPYDVTWEQEFLQYTSKISTISKKMNTRYHKLFLNCYIILRKKFTYVKKNVHYFYNIHFISIFHLSLTYQRVDSSFLQQDASFNLGKYLRVKVNKII